MEDLTLFQTFMFAVVGYGFIRILRRRFKKKDAAQFQKQVAAEPMSVIASHRFVKNKIVQAVQEGTILSVYATTLIVIVGIGVHILGTEPVKGAGTLAMDVLITVVTLFPILIMIFSVALLIVSRRATRQIPLSLVSRKYSLVSELYINTEGFEGVMALPWSKIYRCEERGPSTLIISYRRSPQWLTKLVGADTLILAFNNEADIKQILALYDQTNQAK